MCCNSIKEKLSSGSLLFDVSSIEEFNNNRVEGAKHLELARLNYLVADKETELLLYCRSGIRSQMATNYLKSLGFNAINIGAIEQYAGCIDY